MSAFSFLISIFVSTVQHFRIAIKSFKLFKKLTTFKQKQLSKIGLFLKIDPVRIIGMRACVCVHARGY